MQKGNGHGKEEQVISWNICSILVKANVNISFQPILIIFISSHNKIVQFAQKAPFNFK